MKKKSDILKTTVTNEMGLPYSRPEMGSIDPHLNSSSKSCSEALNDGMHSHCSKHSCQGSGIEMLSDSTHCHCKEHKGMNKCSKLLNDSAHPHANDEMCQSDCGKMLSDINHLHVNRQKCSCCKMFSDSAQPHFNDHKCSSSCNEVLSNDAHSLLTVQKCHSKEFTGKMHHPCSRQECPNNYSETLSDNSSTHPDLNSKECLCDCSETEEATVGFYGPSSNSERDNDRCSTDEANANQESSSERNNDHCSRDTSTIHGSNSERENDRCSKDERHPRHDNNSERYNDHCSKETNASQDSSSEKENDHCSKDETNASHDGNTEKENDHCSKDETNTRQDSNSERENDSCSSDETNTRHDRNSEKDNVCCSKDGTNVSHNGNSERENDHCGKDEKNASQDSSSERQNDNCSRGETNTRQDSNSVRENGHCSKDETNTSQGSKYETNVSHNRNSERENDCIIKDETNTSQDSSSERKNDRYRREDTVNDCPSNKMDNDQSSNNKSDNKHYSKDERDSNYHSNSDCSAGSQEELTNEVAAQSTYDKDAYVMLDEMDADDDSEDLRYRSDHFMGGAAEILGQMMSTQPLDWEDDVDDPVEQAMAKYKVNRTNDNNKTRPSSAQEASELSAVQQRGQADCCQLLRAQGISTNEAPRDIAMALKHTCPSLATNSSPTHNQHTTTTAHKPATFQGLFTRNSESWQPQVNKSDFSQNSRRTTSDNTSGTRGGGRGFLSLLRQTLSSASSTESASSKNQGSFKNTDTSSKGTDSTKVSSRTNGEADSGRKGDRGWSRERGSESSGAGRQGGVPAKKEKTQTVWSHYLYGDTEINEICYYSVEGQCRNESTGCQRLHSAQHFHWQVSEQGSKWLNLRPFQSTCLERAYCDPGQDGANIPRLDPSKLSQSLGKLLTVLGRETWQANFEAMILHNSDQSQLLYIRRLCTQYIPGQKVPASVHSWYFRDKNNKWVKYGNVDTAGETKLVSSVTSADIERHYWTQKQQPLTFKNASYTYVLDFVAMTQKNQNTKVKREVRRRPEPHIRNNDAQDGSSQKSGGHMSDGKASSSKAASDSSLGSLPSFWNPMQPEERLRMVTVPSGSSEYRSVAGLLGSNSGNLVKVERIQNPFVWRALQNKIRDMTLTYRGDIKKVDVRQLFHGTKPDVVASICAENFDWRLHGTSTGQASGRGTYFSPNFNTSYRYCHPDSSGHKYIFVARVAVGSITQGNSSTVRPPINPATGHPYESTGDGVSVVVKYDKQEYCPEYLLTLQ